MAPSVLPSTQADARASVHAPSIDEHKLDVTEVAARYGTSAEDGLTSAQVASYHATHAANALSGPPRPNYFLLYLKFVFSVFGVMLFIAGSLSFILYVISTNERDGLTPLVLGVVLLAVALMNGAIEFVQHYRTESLLQSFLTMVPAEALVRRDGTTACIPAAELVPGDLVIMRPGNKVPADLRLVRCSDMRVDNSTLTGESEPQERAAVTSSQDNPLEAPNLLFNGTVVVAGEGIGIVIRTGDATVLGQIAGLTLQSTKRASQLTAEIAAFVKRLAVVAVLTAALFFGLGFVRGFPAEVNFAFGVGVFVAFVPQGLPVTVTSLLSIAAKRMAKVHVLVKDLHAVETLGSITLLATDKTGTLTMNRMAVVAFWIGGVDTPVPGSERANESQVKPLDIAVEPADVAAKPLDSSLALLGTSLPTANSSHPAAVDPTPASPVAPDPSLLLVCALCSQCRMDAAEREKTIDERAVFGDATEVGLYKFAMQYVDVLELASRYPRVLEVPFTSATKWHMTVHLIGEEPLAGLKGLDGLMFPRPSALPEAGTSPPIDASSASITASRHLILLKGAPERVWARCDSRLDNAGTVVSIGPDDQARFDAAYARLAGNGYRVLGAASSLRTGPPPARADDPALLDQRLTFIGLVALIDPPKHGVRRAIAACRTAGIQVVMVTGDHPLTAKAIARQIGLVTGETVDEAARRLNRAPHAVPEHEYDSIVVHGDRIDGMLDSDWDRVLSKREIVFARTSPRHKLMIVERAQAKGHIVGVSGDGVNDSPALKKADLGISMNKTASDVSKDAAAMILLDDHFPSIVNGIQEGRLLFANLKKSIQYTLSHIVPELAAFFALVAFGLPLPLTPLLLLFIDLGSELAPALSFAWEAAESDLMRRPPRKVLCTTDMSLGMYERELDEHPGDEVASPSSRPSGRSLPAALDEAGPRPQPVVSAAPKSISIEIPASTSLTLPPSPLRADKAGSTRSRRIFKPLRRVRAFMLRHFGTHYTGETLVDTPMLLWAYLMGGMFSAAGCMAAYLLTFWYAHVPASLLWNGANGPFITARPELLAQAQSAYYCAVVIGQMFVLFMVKRRFGYPVGRAMFANWRAFVAIAIATVVAAIVVYVPLLQFLLGTADLFLVALLGPIFTGCLLFLSECARRFAIQKGLFGAQAKPNINLLELVRTSTSAGGRSSLASPVSVTRSV